MKDGEVLFAEGYGQADVEAKEPVVADKTLFKLASISKLFTTTAVMQRVEEGRLDLDSDVNAYLDVVEVPNTYPDRPVTLRNLLTHTAGFEDRFIGSGARNAAGLNPPAPCAGRATPTSTTLTGSLGRYCGYASNPRPAMWSWKRVSTLWVSRNLDSKRC